MKEIILVLAMQFSTDFNKPIDHIDYRTGDLNHFAIIRKNQKGYEITFDESLVTGLSHQRLKTLVYHMTGKATGMDTTTRKTFMNPKYVLKPYRRF